VLFKGRAASIYTHFEHLDDSHEYLLESLEIPVLVDDSVNHAREEDLLGLVGEKIHKVVHLVDCLLVTHVLLAPLGQQLLSDQEDQIFDVFVVSQIHVLSWVLESHLDFVHKRSAH